MYTVHKALQVYSVDLLFSLQSDFRIDKHFLKLMSGCNCSESIYEFVEFLNVSRHANGLLTWFTDTTTSTLKEIDTDLNQ